MEWTCRASCVSGRRMDSVVNRCYAQVYLSPSCVAKRARCWREPAHVAAAPCSPRLAVRDEVHDLVQIIGEEQEVGEALLRPELLEQRPGRFPCGFNLRPGIAIPVCSAEQDHGRRGAVSVIVVLARVLEDLLNRARVAFGEDDAMGGDAQNPLLANAVLEELGDVGGEGVRRLMTVEPGGHANALRSRIRGVPGKPLHHLEGRPQPFAAVPLG